MKIASTQPAVVVTLDDDLPKDLKAQINQLEKWAADNLAESKTDRVMFWVLKLPAIFASASAGLLAHFQMPTASLLVGFGASFCVLIDSITHFGTLRNAHRRAVHDIRKLTNGMIDNWQSKRPLGPGANGDSVAQKIITDAKKEKDRIADYLRNVETDVTGRSRKDKSS